jgi:phospholipid/cholesterol/gamma-HCH transport system substrate-binding protein
VAAAALVLWPSPRMTRASVHFPRTVGLYPGSDVRILGVKVGTVTAVVPEGTTVRADLQWDAEQKVPRDAEAVVVAPSVVSDRYVQLTPVYRSGPVLADGADIPVQRTATPVELDRIYASLDQLSVALGPKGANRDGALSRLLAVGADNLGGEGAKLNQTLTDFSDAVGTLSDGRKDLFGTVRNLQTFTSALAADDDQVRRFNTDLAGVADQLAGERGDLALALKNLGTAMDDVAGFVKDNRAALQSNVAGLADVTKVLLTQKKALEEFVTDAPVALSNLQNAYNAGSGTLDTRDNFQQTQDPAGYLCSLLVTAGQQQGCDQLRKALAGLGLPGGASGLPGGSPAAGLPSLPGLPQSTGAPDLTLGGILGGAR